jgi:hypothetical protein
VGASRVFAWRRAICTSDLPPTARHVALTLSLYMNGQGGSAFPGAPRLAKETGLSVRAVRQQLRGLSRGGWLCVDSRGGGRGHATEYVAALPKGAPRSPITPTQESLNSAGGSPITGEDTAERVNLTTVKGAPRSPQDVKRTLEPLGKQKRDELFEALLEVCNMNPSALTRSARGGVNGALGQLRQVRATPDAVRAAARAYARIFPTATLTPSAMAKHWPKLTSTPATPAVNYDAPEVSYR